MGLTLKMLSAPTRNVELVPKDIGLTNTLTMITCIVA
jgi:hypothetical protein